MRGGKSREKKKSCFESVACFFDFALSKTNHSPTNIGRETTTIKQQQKKKKRPNDRKHVETI